jgi:hypothetical protein
MVWVVLVYIALYVSIAELVAVLEFAIFICILLNSVVGEVDILVVQLIKAKLTARCTDIPFLIVVPLCYPIHRCHQRKSSNVKLPATD